MGTPSNIRRHSRRGRTALAAFTGAALVSTGLTAAVAPAPTHRTQEIDVALAAANVQTAFNFGPLGGLITPLLNSMKANPVDLVGLIQYNFSGGAATTRGIYDLINNLDYKKVSDLTSNTCQTSPNDACRVAFTFSTGLGTLGMTDAMQALYSASQGKPRMGFDPIKPFTGGTSTTEVVNYYINNMFRPDGGIASRFPDITKLFGFNPNMPTGGYTAAKSPGTASLFNYNVDLAWPYNPLADFPITANPFALANSMLAVIPPPQLIKAVQADGVQNKLTAVLGPAVGTLYPYPSSTDVDKKNVFLSASQCAGTSDPGSCPSYARYGTQGLLFGPVLGNMGPDAIAQGSTSTYLMAGAYNTEIPLLYPTEILPYLVNTLLTKANSKYLLGNPISDVLAPALKILINMGYDDVITPDKLNTIDQNTASSYATPQTYAQENYKAYDRTFAQPPAANPAVPATGTPFAWFNNPAVTSAETMQSYTDAGKAFVDAVKVQAQKPFFGILVPAPTPPPTPPTTAAATPAATVKAAAAVAEAPEAAVEPPAAVVDKPVAAVDAPRVGSRGASHSAGADKSDSGSHTRGARGAG